MKKDARRILKIAKKIVKKETYKKLKKIKDEEELKKTAQYSIIASLEKEHYSIEKEIKELESRMKDVFFAKSKSLLIPSKISHFKVGFEKEEFYKLSKLLNDVKKELENIKNV